MSNNKRAQAQQIASSALDDLTAPGLSIEVPIRKAMRVATLCGHPYWRAWLQMQLVDFRDAEDDTEKLIHVLEASLPDNPSYKKVATNVIVDYMESRKSPALPNKVYGSSITNIESVLANAPALLRQSEPPDAQTAEVVQDSNQMLVRIKNRIQEYLMNIESGDAPEVAESSETNEE